METMALLLFFLVFIFLCAYENFGWNNLRLFGSKIFGLRFFQSYRNLNDDDTLNLKCFMN